MFNEYKKDLSGTFKSYLSFSLFASSIVPFTLFLISSMLDFVGGSLLLSIFTDGPTFEVCMVSVKSGNSGKSEQNKGS